jgi:hypothetical protein
MKRRALYMKEASGREAEMTYIWTVVIQDGILCSQIQQGEHDSTSVEHNLQN